MQTSTGDKTKKRKTKLEDDNNLRELGDRG